MDLVLSTARQISVIILNADGTKATGITGATATIYIKKQGGAFSSAITGTDRSWTEVDSSKAPGLYSITLSTSDTDTAGELIVCAKGASTDTSILLYDVAKFNIHALAKFTTNKTVIDASAKQLKIYDDDGSTVIATYNLTDGNGVPSVENILRRIPA